MTKSVSTGRAAQARVRRVARVVTVERRGAAATYWHGSTEAAVLDAVRRAGLRHGSGHAAYVECVVYGPARGLVSAGGLRVRQATGRWWQREVAARLAAGPASLAASRAATLESARRHSASLGPGGAAEWAAARAPREALRPDAERAAWLAQYGIPARGESEGLL